MKIAQKKKEKICEIKNLEKQIRRAFLIASDDLR